MRKNKLIAGMAAFLILFNLCVFSFHGVSHTVSADRAMPSFASSLIWHIEKDDDSSSVDFSEGKLTINNVSGTSLVACDSGVTDAVIEFSMTRTSDAVYEYDASGKIVYPVPSFGLKYDMNEDYSEGYEVRAHFSQVLTYVNYESVWEDKTTGEGLENVKIADGDEWVTVAQYYYTQLKKSVKYRFRLEICRNLIELYINDNLFLRDYLEQDVTKSNIAFCVHEKSSVVFEDLNVSTLADYGNRMIDELVLPQSGWNTNEVIDYEKKLKAINYFLEKSFTDGNYAEVQNYLSFTQCEEQFESQYGIIAKRLPVITVNGAFEETYEITDMISVPKATAVDDSGNVYYVKKEVVFNGKNVRINDDSSFQANESGEYKVRYTAYNALGECTTEEFDFWVTGTITEEQYELKNLKTFVISAVVFVLVCVGCTIAFIFIKKDVRRKNCDKGAKK